ncbi:MAG: hypothetical protein C0518_06490 [Opitutus sp.]|nr:hypothetical protein [Opitutus sp.]
MPESLLNVWQKTVARHGARIALTQATDNARCTFRELDARARAWAEQHTGARLRGRAVAFSTSNGIAWFEILLGLWHADAVAVPLDPGEPPEELRSLTAALRGAAWWDGAALQTTAGKPRRFDAEDCLIKLTSGSTGAPQPLVFTAAQLLADGRQVMRGMGITARDVNYALIPCGHSYGLGNLVLPLVAAGVPLVCGSAPFPHAIAEDFARWKPSVFPGVPALWRALAASEVQLRGLRLAISAGAPLSAEVAGEFFARHGMHVHSFYGSSETGGVSYDRNGRDTLAGRVGHALPGVKLQVLAGQRLLVTSAAVLTRGNRRRRGARGQWVMADLVERDARGSLQLLGRRGTFVKIAGRRVNLADISVRLRALPGVSDAWVAVSEGAESVLLGAALATTLSPAEIRAAARAHLPAWKMPKVLLTFPALPLTPRGKLETAALRQGLFRGASARR